MPKDIKQSILERQRELALKLNDIRERMITLKNLETMLEDEFINNAEIYGLEPNKSVEGLSIIETTTPLSISLNKVKEQFNGDDLDEILDNLVFTIDYDKTNEALRYDQNIPDTLANSIIKRLESHSKIKVKKVV